MHSQLNTMQRSSSQRQEPVNIETFHGRSIDFIESLQESHGDVSCLSKRELLSQADSVGLSAFSWHKEN